MVTITGIYENQLHCSLSHGPSGNRIETDAPKDNNGKGEAFSPTDLLAASLGSCMMTVMGIYAEKNQLSLSGSHFKVEKIMRANPRMVEKLHLLMNLPKNISEDQKEKLENIALNCPVKLSLHPDIQIHVQFVYNI